MPKLDGDVFPLPTAPGLGVTFNEDALADHAYEYWSAPHWQRRDGSYTNWSMDQTERERPRSVMPQLDYRGRFERPEWKSPESMASTDSWPDDRENIRRVVSTE